MFMKRALSANLFTRNEVLERNPTATCYDFPHAGTWQPVCLSMSRKYAWAQVCLDKRLIPARKRLQSGPRIIFVGRFLCNIVPDTSE